MGWFGIGKKKKEKNLKKMSKDEKKEFLSNDLIERMIRVEQRVSSSFSEDVSYDKTKYYQSLSPSEKKGFDAYIRKKGVKKVLVFVPFLIVIVFIGLTQLQFTGNVVSEDIESAGTSISMVFLLGLFVVYSYSLVFKSRKKTKFEKHFDIVDEIGLNRYLA